MKHATSKAALIAWDMGRGPTYKTSLPERYHALYRVYRDGVPIGYSHAEAFYDVKVRPGAVHAYRAFAVAEDGTETAVGPPFTVHVPRVPPGDHITPSVPEDLSAAPGTIGGRGGIRFKWKPSADSGAGVLAYFVEADNGSQPYAVLWNSGESGKTKGKLTEWTEPMASGGKRTYRLRTLDADLNLSEPSEIATGTAGYVVVVSVMNMYDDGSNFDSVVAAWDAVGLDTCDFECFMAEDGDANWPNGWAGHAFMFPAARWAYPEVFTPNDHWRSLGVKAAHRPADAEDTGNDASWAVPDDIIGINNGTGQSLWWFCLRAAVRVDEPPDGMLRSYGMHAYWPVAHVPDGSMFLDCQLAHNYVSEPLFYNVAALETPSNYDAWPPLP